MELWVGAVNLGFLYAFMVMGVFITFRIHNFPDITVDGSFVTGAAVTAGLIVAGVNPLAAMALSFLAGSLAGAATAFIHTRFAVNGLLAGILVMTGLYSVNLHIMGRSNIPLLNEPGVAAFLRDVNPGFPYDVWFCAVFFVVIALFWLMASLFFRTDLGITMRATGNNDTMARASGVNVDRVKTLGIALANGLVALSGSLVAQYQGFADIGMGTGAIVFGLAAVIIGESVVRGRSIYGLVLGAIAGSVVFRLLVAFALDVGLNPIDLKLTTALFVLFILITPKLSGFGKTGKTGGGHWRLPARKAWAGFAIAVILAGGVAAGYRLLYAPGNTPTAGPAGPEAVKKGGEKRLALFLFSHHTALEDVARGIMDELEKSGTLERHGVTVDMKNAHSDYGTAQAIVQDMVRSRYDGIVTVSSPALQVTANGNRRIPHVFGAVTDPYRMGVARSPEDHLPNITGVATFQPVASAVSAMRALFPEARRVGLLWNPAEANSEACTLKAREAAARYGLELVERTVSATSDVQDALAAMVNDDIDLFFMSGDNTVILAFATVADTLKRRRIPCFTNDPTDVDRGSFFSVGADYYTVGVETAKMAARVLAGEDPKNIPIRNYAPEKIGINLELADLYGVTVPAGLLAKAAVVRR